ncbi:MAG: arsenate reductase (azurin) small subunit [Rhizobiales bacterium]|nr:arsenate reductase (azurin) small subunit [Hyphomicrobiales bacterium]
MADDKSTSRGAGAAAGIGRRSFLKAGAFGLAAGLGAAAARPGAAANPTFPVTEIAAIADLEVGAEVVFEYPDENSPAVLLRLAGPAEGGVGPNESIVAYSLLCTHKGCPVQFLADRQMLICPCHFSSFDAAKSGRIVIGQATEALPQISLKVQDGKVQAVGVKGLIYGRHTNIL